MLFRSKTAINVRFQKLFKTKDSSKSFSQLFNFNGITSVKTTKFSAIVTKLSNDLNAEQNDKILCFKTNNLSNVYKAEQH